VKYRSRSLDFQILCETVKVMLFGHRAANSFRLPGDRLMQLD
jgi:hypothetical protein